MINMVLTAVMLLMILFTVSLNSKEELNDRFGSFYHTGITRGIAVFIILIAHIGDKSGYRFFTPLGGIGVSIFIICSGYGLYKSYLKNGLKNYFKKRFIGLLIPYWIIFICFSIINFNGFANFVKGMLLIEVPSFFWYVQYISMLYIVFFISFKLFKNKGSIIFLTIVSIVLFVFNKKLLLGEQSFAFIIGVLLAKYNIEDNRFKIGLFGTMLLFVGAISLMLKQTSFIREANYLMLNLNGVMLKTITALGLILFIYSILRIRILNIFTIGGKYSYEIYLVHISLVGMLVGKFTIVNIIIFVGLSIVGSFILNIISKQTIKCINKSIN